MSDEPNSIKIPTAWIGPIAKWLILALLGGNLWHTASSDKALTREQSQWDTEIAARILGELREIKTMLPVTP